MKQEIKQALENVKNIKVGSMVLNDLFGEDLKVLENALNDYELQNKLFKEDKKMIVKEYNRLFDLCKEQNEALKIIVGKKVNIYAIMQSCSHDDYHWYMDSYESDFINEEEYNLVKKVVEKYGEKED